MQRWLSADSFADVAGDLQAMLWVAEDREPKPSAVILDSRTLRSSPESGERAGYDGAKRKWGSKLHLAVDTQGRVAELHVTSADTDDRGEMGQLADAVRAETDGSVTRAFVDQGYIGDRPAEAARAHAIELEVVKALLRSVAARTLTDPRAAIRHALARFTPQECRNDLTAPGYEDDVADSI